MKIVIVGGVAGGAAAAARMRRLDEKAEIIMFERGEHISFANCGLPYYAGDVIKERDRLLIQSPESFNKRFNVDVRVSNEVTAINRKDKTVTVKDLIGGNEYTESYDKLILSPGAEPIVPPIEGSDLDVVCKVRTVPDIDRIKKKLDSGNVKRAVVIGGGFIGVEMAENLAERKIETYLVEMLDQVMPPFDKDMAVILHREIGCNGVRLHLNDQVTRIRKTVSGCIVETQTGNEFPCEMVIMSVGVKPEIKLAKDAGLAIGKRGIRVNSTMQTDDKDIFAVGDVVETLSPVTGSPAHIPLAWPAARQALAAVNTINNIKDTYEGSYGTSVLKVFSLTAAMTGATEKALKSIKKDYEKIYLHPGNHAGYYPGASELAMKVLFDPSTQKILGAQVIGRQGTDKRVDVLSVAVKHGLTLKDISELDLCYAPPFGSSKAPINFVGMIGLNHTRGISKITHWDKLTGDELLLDTRTAEEVAAGNIKEAMHIPVDELRDRLEEIPKDKTIAIFCQVGIRGHVANRILMQNGFDSVNISGGYKTYINTRDAQSAGAVPGSCAVEIPETFCTSPTGEDKKG